MSYFFKTWHTRITAEVAEQEADKLFASEPRAISRQLPTINKAKFRPWRKPVIERNRSNA